MKFLALCNKVKIPKAFKLEFNLLYNISLVILGLVLADGHNKEGTFIHSGEPFASMN